MAPADSVSASSIAVSSAGSAVFRPVLAREGGFSGLVVPEHSGTKEFLTAADQDFANEPVVLPDRDGTVAYSLGPAFADGGTAIESVTVDPDLQNSGWKISLTLTEGDRGIGAWNAAARSCYSREPSCADGGMAIVVGHQVVSAPIPQQSTFESRSIQITGNFTESEANRIAKLLRQGPDDDSPSATNEVRLTTTSATGWPMLLTVALDRPAFSKSVEQSPPGKARLVATYTVQPSLAAGYDLTALAGSGRDPGVFGSERGDSLALFWEGSSQLLPGEFHMSGERFFCRMSLAAGQGSRVLECVANLVDSRWGPVIAGPGPVTATADADLDETTVDRLVVALNGEVGRFSLWMNSGVPGSTAVSGGAGCWIGVSGSAGAFQVVQVNNGKNCPGTEVSS